jgi:phage terminase large subunit-like protein
MKDDPLFPKFESLTFPAKAEDYKGKGKGKYRGKYLFPERFPDSWYEGQYATLGVHASSGLLDCSPTVKGGNLIPAKEGVNWHWVDQKPEKYTRLYRCWDLASTKQRAGNDPDWTVGVKLAIKVEVTKIINPNTRKLDNLKQVSIYIDDIIRLREDAVNRNNRMVWTASNDGQSCINFVESFGAQKDTVVTLKGILGGSRIVKGVRHTGDKEYKVTEALEVPFTNGTVYVNRNVDKKVWNECCKELEGFPFASHDDLCLPHYSLIATPNGHVKISGILKGDKVYSFVNSQRVISNVSEVVYTGVQQVYKFTFGDGSIFECNAHHPILTKRGWVKARELTSYDLIAKDSKWLKCSTDISSQIQVKDIINQPLRLMEGVLSYTDTSGKYSQVSRFQQVFTSIILMETEIITILRTYNYCSEKITVRSITKIHQDLLNMVIRATTLSQLEYLLHKLKKVYTSVKLLNEKSVSKKDGLLLASIAVLKKLSIREVDSTLSFAQLIVGILGGKRRDILPRKITTYVSNVIKSLLTTSHAELFVPNLVNLNGLSEEIDYVTMKKKEKMGMVAMYNLVVEDTHNFVSDGVITHNCDALAIGVNELTGKQYSAWWVSK